MEQATVRAEIKRWEKEFKAENGREATTQDIRANPDIAAKYKRYKVLNKASSTKSQPNVIPSTRNAEKTAPLSTFNPFSPQKKRLTPAKPTANIFATPPKPGLNLEPRSPSPDPFAPIPPQFTTPTNSGISRARKRLRGEVVSPSPAKGKKRRIDLDGLFKSLHRSSDSDDEGHAAEQTFIDDSPVKGSSFKLLFEDNSHQKPSKARSLPIYDDENPFSDKAPSTITLAAPQEDHILTQDVLMSDIQDTLPMLLPPSPTGKDTKSYRMPGRKGKQGKKQWKAHVEDEDSDEDADTIPAFRLVSPIRPHDDDTIETTSAVTAPSRKMDMPSGAIEERVVVDLPDQLRDVLALSDMPSKQAEESRVISQLLYGRRDGHYYPDKGGEVWDAGEDTDNSTEEDWESEPVPWEVGEL